jgi:ubiquitin C-terminal hydrolase
VFSHTCRTIPSGISHSATVCFNCLYAAGHFTADVLDAKGRWFRHNDALVQQIWPKTDMGLQRSREETAYMLVYIADGL